MLRLLADRASAHTDHRTQSLAQALSIRFIWLPKQAPELSPMDQLWRELKRLVAANRQAASIDELATQAANWVLSLPARVARQGWTLFCPLLAQKVVASLFANYLVGRLPSQ